MAEISRIERRQSGEMSAAYLEDIRQERARLALIEQRIKEILAVLKSLNSMVDSMLLWTASLSYLSHYRESLRGSWAPWSSRPWRPPMTRTEPRST